MTKIKLCGLSRPSDIEAVNELKPEYIGFVFARKSRRYVTPEQAARLKKQLCPHIIAVGVFVNEQPEVIAGLLLEGTIDMAQLHGSEDENCIRQLHLLTDKPVIKAFRIDTEQDAANAAKSSADYILLDSGSGGTGAVFDWKLLKNIKRPYFLAGGLNSDNIGQALEILTPYAVDVSSGIETAGFKDPDKMTAFVHAVRNRKEERS
ncbi:MAG: phosphoribosylanthranilate isomerase [Coprococcus sp.]